MLANPIVEELILAGPTSELVMEKVALENEEIIMGVRGSISAYTFGCIRVCPALRVAKRFRAFVTWLPCTTKGRSNELC